MKNIQIKVSKRVMIYGAPIEIKNLIQKKYTIPNPVFWENHKRGRNNHDIEKDIEVYKRNRAMISVPLGCLEDIMQMFNKKGIVFNLVDLRKTAPVKFAFKGQLKDFQQPACRAMVEYDTGTLQAATGAGKTVMGLRIVAERSQRTLILVHTKELLNQWIDRIQTFLDCTRAEIGIIGGGKFRIGRRITVGMVQTVCNRLNEIKREFGMIVTDECHRCPSKTFSEVVESLYCKYTLGLSATPFRRDGLTKFIFWYLGPVRHKVDRNNLFDIGQIVNPIFYKRETNFTSSYSFQRNYQGAMGDLVCNFARNVLVCKDVKEEYDKGETCLVLTDRKGHCTAMADILCHKFNLPVSILTGSTKTKERKNIVSGINSGNIKLIVATGQLIGEGFDSNNLSCMFLTTPLKFSGRVLQYIGRVMRPSKSGDRPKVYDYVDVLEPVLRKSFDSRVTVYGKENVREK